MISDPVPLEIACDESGYEGEKLVGTPTDVFADASAGHVLRRKHRAVLTWLLGPGGPLTGHASVFLVDKAFYVVGRLVDLLVDDATQAVKDTLYREEPLAFGAERWTAFLESANILMRTKDRQDEPFFRMVESLRGTGGPVGEIMETLWRAAPYVDPAAIPPLDILGPAVVRAVVRWSSDGTPVTVIHDQQTMLSGARGAQIMSALSGPSGARLAGWPA